MARTRKIATGMALEIEGMGEVECSIEGTYTPGTPDVYNLSNGDPGYPGDPAEGNVRCVTVASDGPFKGRDVTDKLTEEQFEKAIDKLIEAGNDDCDDFYPDD